MLIFCLLPFLLFSTHREIQRIHPRVLSNRTGDFGDVHVLAPLDVDVCLCSTGPDEGISLIPYLGARRIYDKSAGSDYYASFPPETEEKLRQMPAMMRAAHFAKSGQQCYLPRTNFQVHIYRNKDLLWSEYWSLFKIKVKIILILLHRLKDEISWPYFFFKIMAIPISVLQVFSIIQIKKELSRKFEDILKWEDREFSENQLEISSKQCRKSSPLPALKRSTLFVFMYKLNRWKIPSRRMTDKGWVGENKFRKNQNTFCDKPIPLTD